MLIDNDNSDSKATHSVDAKWPDVERPCFSPGPEGHLNACVDWALSQDDSLGAFARGYRDAAITVFSSALENHRSPDLVVFPLVFLWKHHIELALKDIIASGRLLRGDAWGFPGVHKLGVLWQQAKPHIESLGPKKAPELRNVEKNIGELESADPDAVGFRYPLDKEGAAPSMPNAPPYVNLRVLQDAMEAVSNFLQAVRFEQSREFERRREYESAQRLLNGV